MIKIKIRFGMGIRYGIRHGVPYGIRYGSSVTVSVTVASPLGAFASLLQQPRLLRAHTGGACAWL